MSSKQPRQRATSSSWPTTTLRAPWSPRVARLAPSVVLDVRPKGLQHVLELDGGSVELALRTLTKGGDRFKCVGLLEDEDAGPLPNTDPLASSPSSQWDISHAAANRQHVRRRRTRVTIDDAVANCGLARHVTARMPLHSLIYLLFGSTSNAVGPLIMRPLPFASPRVSLSMIWHRRLDSYPAHRWLRGTLRAAVMEG